MSNVGPGDDQWGQQDPYGQPQQPYVPPTQPGYGPPQQPGYETPGYQAPQYGPPQQSGYGPPNYPPGSQQPGYEQPGYQQPGYGGQPPTAYPPTPGSGSAGGGRRKGVLIGSGIAVLIVVAIILFLVLGNGGSSSSDASPADAAKALLSAGKAGSISGVTNAVCSEDRPFISAAALTDNPLIGSDRLTSYTVGAVTQQDASHATVATTYTLANSSKPTSLSLPVAKDGGSWKVCFTSSFFAGGGTLPSGLPTSLPSGLPSGLPTSLPSGLPTSLPSNLPSAIGSIISDVCTTARTSAVGVVTAYVSLAESGQTSAAQGCTDPAKVAASTTARLANQSLTPTSINADDTQVTLSESDGSKVTITVSKEAAGYLVTSVSIS